MTLGQTTVPTLTSAQQVEFKTLTGQLGDPTRSKQTRVEAATLLLSRGYPQAVEALVGFLSDASNRSAQTAVAEAIAVNAATRPEFVDPLMAMLTGDEASVRRSAAAALAVYKDGGVSEKLVEIALDAERDRQVRLAAIESLRRIMEKRSVDALIRLLDDEDSAVRSAAVQSLVRLTNIRSFGADPEQWKQWWQRNRDRDRAEWLADLVESLAQSKAALEADNAQLRERLSGAMEQLYAATAESRRDGLLVEMLKDSLAVVRLMGVKLVDRRVLAGSEKISEDLYAQVRGLLADADPPVREAAALALANIGDGQTAAALAERLTVEESPAVREAVLTALGQLRQPETVDVVLGEVDSKHDRVAAAAASALTRIATARSLDEQTRERAVDTLIDRYRGLDKTAESTRLRESLLTAMGTVGDESVAGVLEAALKNSAATVRLAAVNGLARLGRRESQAVLVPLAADPDRGVRRAAVMALHQLGGASQLQTILQRTDPAVEPDADVRQQAWDATMSILAAAGPAELADVVDRLDEREDAVQRRIEVMKMWVEALRAREAPALVSAERQLARALLAVGRPGEAAGHFAAAYAALAESDSPQTAAAWSEWVDALLTAGDPGVMTLMAEQADDTAFADALTRLIARIEKLQADSKYAAVIALTGEALDRLPQRLTVAQREQLERILAEAREKLAAADRQRVSELAGQLLGADGAASQAAAGQLQQMGARALPGLLGELRKVVAAETPRPEQEKKLVEVIKQIAPQLNGYDHSAAQTERLATIDAWSSKLTDG